MQRLKDWTKTPWWREGVIALLWISGLALAGYGFLLSPGKIPYSPHSDIITYHLASKQVLFRSWHGGHGIPFWRADQVAGGPALINPNALYTNPLHALFYIFSPADAMGWTIWIHLLVGAMAYYVLAQTLGLGRWPRILMATAGLFSFKTLMAIYAGWLSLLPSIVLLPLLFAAVFRLVERPGAGSMLAVGAVGMLCLHGGHLQLVYYAGWFVAAYLTVTQIQSWRAERRREVGRVVAWLSCGSLLAVGISAYLLLPLAAEVPLMSRSLASMEFLQRGHSLDIRNLLTFFHPEALGTPLNQSYTGTELWEDAMYFGVIPLVLSLAGAVLGRRRFPTAYLVAGFVLSLVLSLDTPLIGVLYAALPGFSLFRLHGRMLFLTTLFGIALAGIGLEELLNWMQRRQVRAWLPPLVVACLILIMAGEGAMYAHRYIEMVEGSRLQPKTNYGELLAQDRAVFRIAPVTRQTLNYGWAAGMNLQLITGYEPFNFWHYEQYIGLMQFGGSWRKRDTVWTDLFEITRWDLFDALNMKYLLAPQALNLPADRFDLVGHYRDQPLFVSYHGMTRTEVFVYRNKNFLPRAFWVDRVLAVQSEGEALTEVQRQVLGNLAVVEGVVPETPSVPGNPRDRAEVLEAADGHLALEIENQRRRFLVISEIWHPGWRAVLDGRDLALHRADLALMGAWIPPGQHRLVLDFRPLYWRTALGISIISSMIFMVGATLHVLRARKPIQSKP